MSKMFTELNLNYISSDLSAHHSTISKKVEIIHKIPISTEMFYRN